MIKLTYYYFFLTFISCSNSIFCAAPWSFEDTSDPSTSATAASPEASNKKIHPHLVYFNSVSDPENGLDAFITGAEWDETENYKPTIQFSKDDLIATASASCDATNTKGLIEREETQIKVFRFSLLEDESPYNDKDKMLSIIDQVGKFSENCAKRALQQFNKTQASSPGTKRKKLLEDWGYFLVYQSYYQSRFENDSPAHGYLIVEKTFNTKSDVVSDSSASAEESCASQAKETAEEYSSKSPKKRNSHLNFFEEEYVEEKTTTKAETVDSVRIVGLVWSTIFAVWVPNFEFEGAPVISPTKAKRSALLSSEEAKIMRLTTELKSFRPFLEGEDHFVIPQLCELSILSALGNGQAIFDLLYHGLCSNISRDYSYVILDALPTAMLFYSKNGFSSIKALADYSLKGEFKDHFSTFVNPKKAVPYKHWLTCANYQAARTYKELPADAHLMVRKIERDGPLPRIRLTLPKLPQIRLTLSLPAPLQASFLPPSCDTPLMLRMCDMKLISAETSELIAKTREVACQLKDIKGCVLTTLDQPAFEEGSLQFDNE